MGSRASYAEFSGRLERLNDRRILAAWIGIWLGCGVIAAVAIGLLDHSNQADLHRLDRYGVVVQARVTGTRPRDHNTVVYSYEVGGRTYADGSFAHPPNPEARELSVGDRIHVVYDARDPSVSCACNPRDEAKASQWWRRLIAGLFLGSLVSLVIVLNLEPRLTRLLDGLAGQRHPGDSYAGQ